MSRDVTPKTRRAITRQRTRSVFTVLADVMFWNATTAGYECVHLSSNNSDVVSAASGESLTYIAPTIDVTLPTDETKGISVGTLTISNVDQAIIMTIRALTKPMIVSLHEVNLDEPDVYVASYPEYTARQVNTDMQWITLQLSVEDFLAEPYPGDRMNAANLPGLFF